jgi:hypothetical protein
MLSYIINQQQQQHQHQHQLGRRTYTRILDLEYFTVEEMMSLPVIKTVSDCADFSKTVLPYVSQLNELPQQIFQSITNLQALKVLYVSTNPLITAFAFSSSWSRSFCLSPKSIRTTRKWTDAGAYSNHL